MSKDRQGQVLILSFGGALATLGAVVINMVLARTFSSEDFGTFRQVRLVLDTFMAFALLGLPNGLYYFLPRKERPARGVISENVFLLFLSGLTFPIYLAAGGFSWLVDSWAHNPKLAEPLLIVALLPALDAPIRAFTPSMMSHGRPAWVASFHVGTKALTVLLTLSAVLLIGTLNSVVQALLITSSITLPLSLWLMFRAAPLGPWRPRLSGLKEQLAFGVPMGIERLIGTLQMQCGNYAVSLYSGPAAFAVFANGAMEVPLIGLVTGSIVSVILPELTAHLKNNEAGQALALWQHATVKSAAFLTPLMVLLLLTAEDVMTVLWSARYRSSAPIFQIFLLLLPIRGASFGSLYLADNRRALILMKTTASLFVTAAAVIPLAALYGPQGAAAGTVLSMWGFTVPLNAYFLGRIMKERPTNVLPLKKLGRLLVPSLLAGLPLAGFLALTEEMPVLPAWLASPLRLLSGSLVYAVFLVPLYRAFGILELEQAITRTVASARNVFRP